MGSFSPCKASTFAFIFSPLFSSGPLKKPWKLTAPFNSEQFLAKSRETRPPKQYPMIAMEFDSTESRFFTYS